VRNAAAISAIRGVVVALRARDAGADAAADADTSGVASSAVIAGGGAVVVTLDVARAAKAVSAAAALALAVAPDVEADAAADADGDAGGAGAPAKAFDLGVVRGRLIEICGGAQLTPAFRLVLEAQALGEPVAWITPPGDSFFPPDAADAGVDLDALVVVRVAAAADVARAADTLARSGAFGLLVLDLGAAPLGRADAPPHVPPALQTRLLGLAQKHDAAIVFLTRTPPDAPSLGSLISLRGDARAERTSTSTNDSDGAFVCRLHALKDKRRAPGWTYFEVCRGPTGLR
jgi:recombination protein RecA